MNTIRILSLGLAITAALFLVSGTLGFTSTTADRGVSVTVADDEDAFVGYNPTDVRGAREDNEIEIFTIQNRFNQNISVIDVRLHDRQSDVALAVGDLPTDIRPGDPAEVRATLTECQLPPNKTASIETTVEIRGESVEATLFGESESTTVERSFSISCATGSDNRKKGKSKNKDNNRDGEKNEKKGKKKHKNGG